MKKRPAPYQKILSTKKKTSHWKKSALNKLSKQKRTHPTFMNVRAKSFVTSPTFLFIAIMSAMILLIPALVVMPFSNKQTSEFTAEEQKAEEQAVSEEATLTVAVTRTASDRIENVPLETYVTRVVASEMPTEFEMEALKAQSLAARTYIVNHLLVDGKSSKSKVTDTVQHQVYKNEDELRKAWGSDYDKKMAKLDEAVKTTRGEIITYHKKPITPAFFSTSNGYTENSEDYWDNPLPYLRSVESPWDEASPKFHDQVIMTTNEVRSALNLNVDQNTKINIERTNSNRVKKITVGSHSLSGREAREKLGLSSSDFTVEKKNDHFIFKTKGYGHGIGMSQYGANGMAKEGKNYEEIINYYYKDIEIRSVEEAAPALVVK